MKIGATMKNCVTCGYEFDAAPEMCQGCWYSGAYLARNMAPVLRVLESATGSTWHAEHTGGGCFWLRTWINPEADGTEEIETEPYIVITAHCDVLSGDDDPESCRDEWVVGTYPTGYESCGEDSEYFDDVADEELPMLVRRLYTEMKEKAA